MGSKQFVSWRGQGSPTAMLIMRQCDVTAREDAAHLKAARDRPLSCTIHAGGVLNVRPTPSCFQSAHSRTHACSGRPPPAGSTNKVTVLQIVVIRSRVSHKTLRAVSPASLRTEGALAVSCRNLCSRGLHGPGQCTVAPGISLAATVTQKRVCRLGVDLGKLSTCLGNCCRTVSLEG